MTDSPLSRFRVGAPFLLGVNYWPAETAMAVWTRDCDEIFCRDLDQMKELGLKLVRIFLLWESLQPEAGRVDPEALARVVRFCDHAAARGLGVDLTFFTGHMSGPNWAPSWMLSDQEALQKLPVKSGEHYGAFAYKNPFSDESVLRAEELLLEEVLAALSGHPAIWVWNLGNEPDLFARPQTSELGGAWCKQHRDRIRKRDERPVTCGLHVASLEADIGLRVDAVFRDLDFATMHAYPMYSGWSRGKLDPDFVPFTCRVTSELSGKPALMEEFGGPTAAPGVASSTWEWTDTRGQAHKQFVASEKDFAGYIEEVLPRLVEVGALGAMFWCWSDYVPELFERPPCSDFRHERHFGIVRSDCSLKPHGEVIRAFASLEHKVLGPPDKVLDVHPDDFYQEPMPHLRRLYAAHLRERKDG